MWGRLVESKFLVYMKNMFRAFATRSLFVHLFLFVQTEMGGGVGGQVRGNVRCTRCKKKVRQGRRHFSSYTKVVDQKLPRKALLPGKKRTRPSSSSSESQLLSPFPSLVLSRRRSLSLSLPPLSLSLTVYLRLGSPFSPRLTVLRAAAAAAAAACGSLEACTCARSSRSPLVELDKETTQQRVRVLEPRATFSIRTRPRDRSERARLREDRETP